MLMDFFLFLLFFCSLRSSFLVVLLLLFPVFSSYPSSVGVAILVFRGLWSFRTDCSSRLRVASGGLLSLYMSRIYLCILCIYICIFMYLYLCMSWPKIYPGTFRFTAISLPVCGRNRVSGFRRHWWALGSQILSWCFVRRFFISEQLRGVKKNGAKFFYL
jgi:hypothetical protein